MTSQDALNKLVKIEEALTCIVCQGIVEDPHTLFCGHAFCGVCILQWCQNKKACPTCREPVRRQPIHVNILQKLSELLRPANAIPTTRLTREDWIKLFPVQHQAGYIRDEDEDGVIYRCSECGWELDEENYCARCLTHYGDDPLRPAEPESDTESRHYNESEGELSSGFVVSDNESLEYSDGHTLPDEGSDQETRSTHNAIEINDSSDEDQVQNTRTNRKRRIEVISDEEEEDESNDSDDGNNSNVEYPSDDEEEDSYKFDYGGGIQSDVEEESDDYEEEYPIDPFPRSRFIDDYADEDDDIEEIPFNAKQPKDAMTEMISKAKDKMISKLPSEDIKDPISDSSDDSDSDAPDYGGIAAPLSGGPSKSKLVVISDEEDSPNPTPSTSKSTTKNSSKKSKKRVSKKDKKRHKKHK